MMHRYLSEDRAQMDALLQDVVLEARRFLDELETMPAGSTLPASFDSVCLSEEGLGTPATLDYFKKHYTPWISGSAGPRFYGLVTGGVTPAALTGDWLVSVYDQNTVGSDESVAPHIEAETLSLLRQLFGLPDEFRGSFVTGATMSNFAGLAVGRQWLGHQLGRNIAQSGTWGLDPIAVYSGTPHSSVYKALSMLGMGREAIKTVPCLPEREAVEVALLEEQLKQQNGRPCIVVANAGTVNTVDFDDLGAIAKLRERYAFWLHVDAAFGGFAACSQTYRSLTQGWELADSITIDAHKWLNVPYDAAMQFTRHQALQAEVFQNSAGYLEPTMSDRNFIHLTPENSRRFRALPCWFSLMAYGKQGYADIVEQNCRLAASLGKRIDDSEVFELLAPVRLNGICFTFAKQKAQISMSAIKAYLKSLQRHGGVFLTPTVYKHIPAIRISISNWRTTEKDVDVAWEAMLDVIKACV